MGPAGAFEIHGKADRIDRLAAGGLVLVDYKTGGVPSGGDIELGFSPQLPLEAAMIEAGGFPALPGGSVAELAYWRLTGGDPAGEIRSIGEDGTALRATIDAAVRGLAALIAAFDDPATPYRSVPWPEKAPRYADYAHLARVKEWSLFTEVGE
jgi:ATP-dependent helicase/nuclease subunit B